MKYAEIEPLTWSKWLEHELNLRGKVLKALFRFRPIICDDNGDFQLYLSAVYPKTEFAEPAEYTYILYNKLGPYFDMLNISKLVMKWLDPEGLIDEFRIQGIWQAGAALELLNNCGHTGVFSKWHAFDKFYYFFFDKIDPASPCFVPEEFEYYEKIHQDILEIADEMVGIILNGMDKDTTLFVLSDHGLQPASKFAWVNNYLAEHGYIVTYKDDKGNERIDWQRTKAIMNPYVIIWINLKGRDPQGCVSVEEYDALCDEIIEVLRDWKDPETDKHVLADVFRTSDGGFYGLWGERDGDIRIFTSPGYTLYRSNHVTKDRLLLTGVSGEYKGDHGSCRPSASFGRGSETAIFGVTGNGIKMGYLRKVPIKPCDIVPTICCILDIEVPSNCEGAVLYDILEK